MPIPQANTGTSIPNGFVTSGRNIPAPRISTHLFSFGCQT